MMKQEVPSESQHLLPALLRTAFASRRENKSQGLYPFTLGALDPWQLGYRAGASTTTNQVHPVPLAMSVHH